MLRSLLLLLLLPLLHAVVVVENGPIKDGPSGAEHVVLNVFDSADVQLVVCCVFAVLLLWREGP